MKRDLWNTLNNRGKVSINLLTESMVRDVEVSGKKLIVIRIPRAERRQRPVYVGQNPLVGTYRRNNEGDYHCPDEVVRRMLADQTGEPADCRILEHFGLDDLDETSLQQYRALFASRDPVHPTLQYPTQEFFERLGGWRRDRATGVSGLTVAGLLMFGKDEAIRDPAALPNYQVDYRERLSDDPEVRWTDRITIDGKWRANLFQFYRRVSARLPRDVIRTPFALDPNMVRRDDTVAHQALREALVNTLIHADYYGHGGIVIEKRRELVEMSNPGTLLVSLDQLYTGGISECRNKSLQTMFQMIGGGEKAGSGWDKIRTGWASQNLQAPDIRETTQPDRVVLSLPTISLLPQESVDRLRNYFGPSFDSLSKDEVRALVTAEVRGYVTNGMLQRQCELHPTDITKLLRRLADRGRLVQYGEKRWTEYTLPAAFRTGRAGALATPPTTGGTPPTTEGDPTEDVRLLDIANPSRENDRLRPDETERIIVELCQGRYLSASQIGKLLNRDPEKTRDRFLTPLSTAGGRLRRRYPDEPNHPQQAYTAAGTN